MADEPKYVMSVTVTCRRITSDPLRTSMDTLFACAVEMPALKAYRLLKDVQRAASSGGCPGADISQGNLKSLQQLVLDAKTE